jgi:hypothetical protein
MSAAVQHDRRTALLKLRDRLAATLDDDASPAHVMAPVARELRAVLAELEALDDDLAPSVVDDLAARVAARRQAAAQ